MSRAARWTGCSDCEKLQFPYQGITQLDADAFVGMTGVMSVDLKGNKITEIPVFNSGFENLRIFDMSYNKITSVSSAALASMRNLKVLDLRQNLIESMGAAMLRSNPQLDNLQLSDNRIVEVPRGWMSHNNAFAYVVISNNKINYIPDDMFINQTRMVLLAMQGNPLECSPNLKNIPESAEVRIFACALTCMRNNS